MIDIAIADCLNVNTKETEKLNKYLEIEVNGMWEVNVPAILMWSIRKN